MVNVAMEAKVHLYGPSASWINQADCIDMDCDGPKVTSHQPAGVCCFHALFYVFFVCVSVRFGARVVADGTALAC